MADEKKINEQNPGCVFKFNAQTYQKIIAAEARELQKTPYPTAAPKTAQELELEARALLAELRWRRSGGPPTPLN